MDWRKPLDELTLRFLISRLTEDREQHLSLAKEAKSYDESAGEAFMVRAEECGRIIGQMRKQVERLDSTPPPPPPPVARWPNH